jgi:hypothetical protein
MIYSGYLACFGASAFCGWCRIAGHCLQDGGQVSRTDTIERERRHYVCVCLRGCWNYCRVASAVSCIRTPLRSCERSSSLFWDDQQLASRNTATLHDSSLQPHCQYSKLLEQYAHSHTIDARVLRRSKDRRCACNTSHARQAT